MNTAIKTDDVIFNFFKQICDEKNDKKCVELGNEWIKAMETNLSSIEANLNGADKLKHLDEIKSLPLDAFILAENDHSPVQAFGYSSGGVDFWGTQYHPECTALTIAEELKLSSKHVVNKAALINDLEASQDDPIAAERLGTTCEELQPSVRNSELRNWLKHIKKPH